MRVYSSCYLEMQYVERADMTPYPPENHCFSNCRQALRASIEAVTYSKLVPCYWAHYTHVHMISDVF